MNNKDMFSAAFHEAGHAVISHKLGFEIQRIEIHLDDERNRWEGGFHHKLNLARNLSEGVGIIRNGAKVAIAGMLSQAKYNAITDINKDLRISDKNELDVWYLFFQNGKRTFDNPGSIRMIFETKDGSLESHEVDGRLFSQKDHQALKDYYILDDAELDTAFIKEVIEDINDLRTWEQIGILADALCESNIEGERILNRDTILRYIETNQS